MNDSDPSLTRTITDFLAVFLDSTAAAMGVQSALAAAARAVRGRPGAAQLAELVDGTLRHGWAATVDGLADLARRWASPSLESLATALRAGDCLRSPMQSYLLACTMAEATR